MPTSQNVGVGTHLFSMPEGSGQGGIYKALEVNYW